MLRIATLEDITSIASIHSRALADSFLGSFGERYLREFHYPKVFSFDRSITVVSEEKGTVVGFVTFVTRSAAFEEFISEKTPSVIFYTLAAVARKPKFVRDVLAILKGTKLKMLRPNPNFFQESELFTIAIDPSFQGRGVGSLMIRYGLNALKNARPLTADSLCLVKTHTRGLARFYRRNGYSLAAFERRGSTNFAILAIHLK